MAQATVDNNQNPVPAPKIDREALLSQFGDEATWQQTLENAFSIARREVRDSFRDWRIMVPIFLLTLVFPVS